MDKSKIDDSYHVLSKVIHWITALLIMGLLFLGFYMSSLDFSESKLRLYGLHKSFGLLVLCLVGVRVFWHMIKPRPKSLSTHKRWEKALAHLAHAFLYLAMFALPISGWLMSSAGDFPVAFFGLAMPDLVAKNESVFLSSRQVHEVLALTLVLVVGLHFVGAFKHHFIDRDITLNRMVWPSLSFKGGLVLFLVICVLYAPSAYLMGFKMLETRVFVVEEMPATFASEVDDEVLLVEGVAQWGIDKQISSINFTATQYGQNFKGTFSEFDGQIFFDERRLDESHVRIEVQISSIETGSDDRDVQAKSSEWFDVVQFPWAIFEAQEFEKNNDGTFLAKGTLTIRSVTLPIEMPFSLVINRNDTANMTAELALKRLDFDIGQGQWQGIDAIGNNVSISVVVHALRM